VSVPESSVERPRVVIANRADGGVLFWLGRLYAFAIFVIGAIVWITAHSLSGWTVRTTRDAPELAAYAHTAPSISRVYAADGTLLGEFAKEWREITPFESMPKPLVDAFIAIEDHDFWSHDGIYYKGIVRAAWANLTAGDFAQGGSTITQQLAKQFLGNQKSLVRKAREAVLAKRLEDQYSKRAILSVYLNHIYLGAGAYGVAAAAHRYFGKKLDELTLAESAMIAGLARTPARDAPTLSKERALERRDLVLERMQRLGLASPADVAAARAEPLALHVYRNVYPDRMPFYAEHVQSLISERYDLMSGGYTVETAVEPAMDAGAYDSTDFGARHQDKRQGWRGPEWTVDGAARDLFVQRQKERYGSGPLIHGKRYLALVDKVDGDSADLIIGDRKVHLPLRNAKWASKWESGNAPNDVPVDSMRRVVRPGDVVWVARESHVRGKYRDWFLPEKKEDPNAPPLPPGTPPPGKKSLQQNPAWRQSENDPAWDEANPDVVVLEQVPHPQGAIFTADHRTGYVVAMVGAHDYDRSVYNRTNHPDACRQPGSTYKPIYYSLALDEGYGFDTILNDVPVKIIDPNTGIEWTPTNLNDTLDGDVTLEYALVFSKNIPSVDIFKRLGAKNVEAWARRLGFTTKIFADDALALGASCTRLDELTRAFALFARDGKWWPRSKDKQKDWIYIRRVVDRAGNVLEDNTVAYDPQLPPADRFDRVQATVGLAGEQAIPVRTAFLTNKLLGQMVEHGFTKTMRQTEIHAGGKTGTSSDTHDTSFVAYTSRHITAVWLGDDQKQRALGRNDAAFMTVVPLWARYMYDVARGFPNPEVPWSIPPGQNPKDRGEHSKGKRTSPMDLIYHHPKKEPQPGTGTAAPPA
jgi:penicillin-binding protein 1A